jgi:hypothetical protein
MEKNINFISAVNFVSIFGHQNLGSGSVSGSALPKNAGSGSVSGFALRPMRIRNTAQREGMGLREYPAILSLHDVLHDGWLCTFTIRYNSRSQLGSSCQGNRYCMDGKGRRYGPSITDKITPAGSLSHSQPGGPPCWASPLAFGPHWVYLGKTRVTNEGEKD